MKINTFGIIMTHVPRWLISIEIISIIVWLSLVTALFVTAQTQEHLQPLTVEALETSSSSERWNGLFFHDQQVGFSVSRTNMGVDGNMLLEQRSMLRIATFGKLQTITTASAALTDKNGFLRRFDFFMNSESAKLTVRGEVKANKILMELDQGNGEIQTLDFPIENPPHVSLSLESKIRQTELTIGKEFSVPFFDPVSMSEGEMIIRVFDTEILENGEEAWWIKSSFNGIETRSLVTTTGDILRQEGAMGISMVRMTAAEAQKLDSNEEIVDLISLSAVNFKGKIKNPREIKELHLKIEGVHLDKILNTPPLQTTNQSIVSIVIPSLNDLPSKPIADKTHSKYLESSLTIPSNNLQIIQKAEEIINTSTNRVQAVQQINQFVFDYMEKIPVIGVPNGLSSLKNGQGDCNEHTALFVSLARSVGIPTKIVSGVVYSDRTGPVGQFYYHAWPEVLLDENIWVPVDPTFGQVPADATHLKLVEGDLEHQVEIMAFIGQLKLERVEQK
jgi:hypothetical protein